jgi:DNA-binding transcriptional regulator YiaG
LVRCSPEKILGAPFFRLGPIQCQQVFEILAGHNANSLASEQGFKSPEHGINRPVQGIKSSAQGTCINWRGLKKFRDREGMSPEQSPAGRGWLGWSQTELARRANVSLRTVRAFETGQMTPIANNIAAMRRAIEMGGCLLQFGESKDAAGIARQVAVPTGEPPSIDRTIAS